MLYSTLWGKSIEKNILASTVIRSTTSPSGIEIIYKFKLLIENNNVNRNKIADWQVIIFVSIK